MKISEFLSNLESVKINTDNVRYIEDKYQIEISEEMKQVISSIEEDVFFEEGCHIFSFEEVMNDSENLGADFLDYKLIPLVDCYDNDFITYNFSDKSFTMFNIIDNCVFNSGRTFKELLEKRV